MNQPPSKLAYLVVIGQIVLAVVLVSAICACLFYKNYADPATLTAIIVLASNLVGNLGSILGGPNRMSMAPANQDVTIINPKTDPVPVAQTPERKP